MLDPSIILNNLTHAITSSGAQIVRVDSPASPSEIITVDDRSITLDNQFYMRMLVRKSEQGLPPGDLDVIYTLPAAQTMERGVARTIRSAVLSALARPNHLTDVVGNFAERYPKGHLDDMKIRVQGMGPQIDQIVRIDNQNYAIIEAFTHDGICDVMLDRPLQHSVDVHTLVVGGLMNASAVINPGGVVVVAPPLKLSGDTQELTEKNGLYCRTTRINEDNGCDVTFDVLVGVNVDLLKCSIDHTKIPSYYAAA